MDSNYVNDNFNKNIMEELAADGRPARMIRERYTPYPFDTERIAVTTQPIPISTIVRRLKRGLIKAAEMQRDSDLWNTGMKSRLIESILLKLPLPLFYVSESKDEKLYIVDGLQRISTIRSFMIDENGFALEGLEFLRHLEGKKYDDLPDNLQIRIEETPLQFVIIGVDSPPEVQRNIFKRLNTGGLPLSDQEIRHALYFGKSSEFLQKLANLEQFKKATHYSIDDSRMEGRELILYFIAFYMFGEEQYPDEENENEMDSFLCDAMQILNDMHVEGREPKCTDFEKIESDFILAMERAIKLFGDKAFRKLCISTEGDFYTYNGIINILFEVWSVILAQMDAEDFSALLEKRVRLYSMLVEYTTGWSWYFSREHYLRVRSFISKLLED